MIIAAVLLILAVDEHDDDGIHAAIPYRNPTTGSLLLMRCWCSLCVPFQDSGKFLPYWYIRRRRIEKDGKGSIAASSPTTPNKSSLFEKQLKLVNHHLQLLSIECQQTPFPSHCTYNTWCNGEQYNRHVRRSLLGDESSNSRSR